MIDIHSHILPGVDDGPEDLESALALARTAATGGTAVMVATPHVLNGLDVNRNMQLLADYNRFKRKLKKEVPGLKLILGSEIYFRPRLADLSFLEVATYGGAEKYMLVEFPLNDIPRGYDRELRNLVNSGIIPVIAHPERNAVIMRKPAMIGHMIDIGVLIQLNAGSLTGSFGRQIKTLAQNLLKRGWVHVIASDAHSANHRGPELASAVIAAEEVVGAADARRLVQDNPEMIVEGMPWPKKESLMFSFGGV